MTRPSLPQTRSPIDAKPNIEVLLRQADGSFRKTSMGVKKHNFYGRTQTSGRLVIGFDTEYVPPDGATSREDLKEGKGKARVVSYQVACRLVDDSSPENGREWGAVFYPTQDGQRYSLADIVTFAIARGVDGGHVTQVPRRIEMVSHFSRADMPMLEDFAALVPMLESVRSVFVTMKPIDLEYGIAGHKVEVELSVSDTILLTAAGAKKLSDLGEAVDMPKIVLSDDPKVEKTLKKRMDLVLKTDPDLFERYALADAQICVRYYERIRSLCKETIGESDVPLTLSGIGVKRLQLKWSQDDRIDPFHVVGKEQVPLTFYNRKTGRYLTKKVVRNLELVDVHEKLAIEAYHGGRGEQYWFGPGPDLRRPHQVSQELAFTAAGLDGVWNDFDLSSAYPTAMSLIGYPDWGSLQVALDVSDYTPMTLGVALVKFCFPKGIDFPNLPVRTANGLIFPRSGRSYCSAPEIASAVAMGADIEILYGVIVPYVDGELRPFGEYVKDCIVQRKAAAAAKGKGSLEELFWKELTNATYGKLAQGLREKRVFSMADLAMVPLKPSAITNPFFASYVTGFVRALLAEIMNGLPKSVVVFSCTTDGFLSTATDEEAAAATRGVLGRLYSEARAALTGDPAVVEAKHQIKRPLGWRTRGQATLVPGNGRPPGDKFNYVLAKAGIKVDEIHEGIAEENDEIVRMFMNRSSQDIVRIKSLTGIRDIVLAGNDLVERDIHRRLGMEYDFKRRPSALGSYVYGNHRHVAWRTEPWDTIAEFESVRAIFDEARTKGGLCVHTQKDYLDFALRVASKTGSGDTGYVQRKNPDIQLLKRELCSAFHHRGAGLDKSTLGLTAARFAEVLTAADVPCKRSDVENGSKRAFGVGRVTDTPRVRDALAQLKGALPSLKVDDLIASQSNGIDLLGGLGSLLGDGQTTSLKLWKLPKAA